MHDQTCSRDRRGTDGPWYPRKISKISSDEVCKWGLGLLKSRLCFLTSKKHKQDYKQRRTTSQEVRRNNNSYQYSYYIVAC